METRISTAGTISRKGRFRKSLPPPQAQTKLKSARHHRIDEAIVNAPLEASEAPNEPPCPSDWLAAGSAVGVAQKSCSIIISPRAGS